MGVLNASATIRGRGSRSSADFDGNASWLLACATTGRILQANGCGPPCSPGDKNATPSRGRQARTVKLTRGHGARQP